MSLLRRLLRISSVPGLAILSLTCLPALAKPRNIGDYPMRLQILRVNSSMRTVNGATTGYEGNGNANLTDGVKINAVDYTFDCTVHLDPSIGDQQYPVKWRKQGQTLVLLASIIGKPGATEECELKVTVKDFVYSVRNDGIAVMSQEQYQQTQQLRKQVANREKVEDADPAHYPVLFAIVSVDWEPRDTTGVHGTGQGNLRISSKLFAADFAITCPNKIVPSVEGSYYRGQWRSPQSSLILLTHQIGDPSALSVCELKTSVRPDVYVRQGSGNVAALSQAQYSDYVRTQATTPALQPPR